MCVKVFFANLLTLCFHGLSKKQKRLPKIFLGVVFRIFTPVTIFIMNYGDFIKIVETMN